MVFVKGYKPITIHFSERPNRLFFHKIFCSF